MINNKRRKVSLICVEHPNYKANQRPRTDCSRCWQAFERGKLAWRQTMKLRKKVLNEKGKCLVCGDVDVKLALEGKCFKCLSTFNTIDMWAESASGIRSMMVESGIPLQKVSGV